MDKTYFIDIENNEHDKMVFLFKNKSTDQDLEKYERPIQLQFHKLLEHYGLDGNNCVGLTSVEIDADKNILLTAPMVDGINSKKYIRSKLGLLNKEKLNLANPFTIAGGKNAYNFSLHNIDEPFDETKIGLFVFAIRAENIEQDVTWQTQYQYILLRFDTVLGNNKEYIEYAQKNGALQFFYMLIGTESAAEKVIADIKEGDKYKRQLEHYPEMIIHNP